MAFSQKGLMRSSFLQTEDPNYFPELEFWFFFHSKWLKSCQIRTWSCPNTFFEHSEQFHVLILHDLSHLEWKGLSAWRNDKRSSPFWEKDIFSRNRQKYFYQCTVNENSNIHFQWRKLKMHSATNYYLFSLAVTDLLLWSP